MILSNCTHSEHDAERMRAKLLKHGAPGEIRTPDLQLRRQSTSHRPSINQSLTAAIVRPCAALSASIEHILNTAASRKVLQNPRPPRIGNDQILCGNVASTFWHVTPNGKPCRQCQRMGGAGTEDPVSS